MGELWSPAAKWRRVARVEEAVIRARVELGEITGVTVPPDLYKSLQINYTETDEKRYPKKREGSRIVGINNLDLADPAHFAFLCGLSRPEEVIAKTSQNYLDLVERLTGKDLDTYRSEDMGIPE